MLRIPLRRRRRFLVTHAWLRGNLGDYCLARRLLLALRRRFPDAHVELVSVPAGDWRGGEDLKGLVDSYGEQPYGLDLSPAFHAFDAVINAPGGGLQTPGDLRGEAMLRDAAACAAMGVRHAFAGHSLHPSFDTSRAAASFFVAREPKSHALLASRGHRCVAAADPAFLEEAVTAPGHGRTLLFLRHDHVRDARLEGRTLVLDGRTYALPDAPLALASSDPRRDAPLLTRLAGAWGAAYEPSETLPHLLALIAGAGHVAGDRYHPVIFARSAGVPSTFVTQRHSLRDAGLQALLDAKSDAELKAMAREGMDALCDFVA